MHKRIGILGGLTPESTITYYQHIVRRYTQRFGDHGYPEIVIYSVSFQQYEDWMEAGEWDVIADHLRAALARLAASGVDFVVMATNTMHLLIDRLQASLSVPIVSIVDTTAAAIKEAGLSRVGLLGTRFTMEKTFYAEGLARHGIEAIAPDKPEREYIHKVILEELSVGELRDGSRRGYLRIIDRLVDRGARGIVLGCTEIPLLIRPEHAPVPVFDTAVLHAERALAFAIGEWAG